MSEKCNTKYCRGEVALTYLGNPLCQPCYEKVCDLESENEWANKVIQEFAP